MADEPIYGISDKAYAPAPQHYPAVQSMSAGYVDKPGTIDLTKRQIIDNPENPKEPDPREYGSEYSARDSLPDGRIMSYPTIYDGARHSADKAFQHAQDTGQHLGIYHPNTPPELLDKIENALHSRPIKVNGQILNGDKWAALKASQRAKAASTFNGAWDRAAKHQLR